jgi:hypothetical protein
MENMIDPLNKDSKSRNISQEKEPETRHGHDEGIGSVRSKDHQDFLQGEISKIMSEDEDRAPKVIFFIPQLTLISLHRQLAYRLTLTNRDCPKISKAIPW